MRTALTVLAVALGVAAVLAIELAGDAAAGSFHSSMETLIGTADFEVTSAGGVPAAVLARLARLPFPIRIHPRIEDYAYLPDSGRTVPLLGVDMLAESSQDASFTGDQDVFERGDSIWVGDHLAYKVGDTIRIQVNDSVSSYIVRGVLARGSGDVLMMDLAEAARVLGRGEMLDRILIDVPSRKSTEEWTTILRRSLSDGVNLDPEGSRTEENRKMLAAFRWNLRVLSYIALAVGAFLIYNTISVSVVRRRYEIGILRALGATRAAILGAFLGEAAAFGLAGAFVGIALGRLMAAGAVKMVAATVSSLYVTSQPGAISLDWSIAMLAMSAGLGVALASALSPAWEASRVAPVEAMARGRREYQTRVHRFRDLAFALALGFCAWIASRQAPIDGRPIFGYASAVLLIASATLTIPALVAALSSASAMAIKKIFGVEALLATRSLAGSLRRTSVLVAALATAIAMLAAVGIMVGSFRQTVFLWMEDRLQADLYLRPAVPDSADRHPTISASVADALEKLPQVAAVDRFRAYEISYQGLPATLGGGDARIAGRYGDRPFFSGRSPRDVFPLLVGKDAALVSEPFANKHHVRSGDTIALTLAGNRVSLHIIDIYYDYSSERGYIILDRDTLLKYLPDSDPSNVAVYLKPGVPLDDGRRAVEAALGNHKVLVFSNRTLRAEAMRVFDRTFAITYALEAVAVFVAIMGVSGALLALVIDRRREFGLLRFLGGGRGQVRRMILFEAGLVGLLANIAGVILGFLLSLLLIFVINKQSFGWTIQFHWPVAILLGALTLVYVATILAGLYPASIATRLSPIEVIHEE